MPTEPDRNAPVPAVAHGPRGGRSPRTNWLLGALAALVLGAVLELTGEWSAGLEAFAVAIVLAVVGLRATPRPAPQPPKRPGP